jgi:hypothetical protein
MRQCGVDRRAVTRHLPPSAQASTTRCSGSFAPIDLVALFCSNPLGSYRAFGIKKTSYRSSVERRDARRARRRPAADGQCARRSLQFGFDRIRPLPRLRRSRRHRRRSRLPLRQTRRHVPRHWGPARARTYPLDPPKTGDVVYADARHVLCRRWNWRQDARSLLTPQTRRAVLTVQSNGFGDVEAAARRVAEGIARECGGISRIVVADRQAPVREF